MTQIDRQESNCRRLWRPRRSLSKLKVQIITIANASANCSGYGEDAIASYCLHCLFYPVLSLCFHHKTFRVEQKKKPSGCHHDNRRAGIILFHIYRERNLTCRPDTFGQDLAFRVYHCRVRSASCRQVFLCMISARCGAEACRALGTSAASC